MNRSRLEGSLLLLSGMALVGTYVALSRPLTAALPIWLLAWLRFGIAALAMLPWLLPARTLFADWRTLVPMSFFGNFLFTAFMLNGVAMTSAATAGTILATLPAVVALLGWLLLRERLRPAQWLAVALAIAGVAVLALYGPASGGTVGASASPRGTPGAGAASHPLLGALLVFACVCCEAIYVVLGKRLTGRMSPMRISAAINLVGLVLMTPAGLAQARGFDFGTVDAGTWALLVFYALSASVFSTWLWLSGLRRIPASESGVFTIAMPLAASLVGVAWLGEAFGAAHAMALGLAAAGILLIARPESGTRRIASASAATGQSEPSRAPGARPPDPGAPSS